MITTATWKKLKTMILSVPVMLSAAILIALPLGAHAEDLPPGVEQIIPRGAIAAIVDPEFVTADEAEIADDAWVLGVTLDGQARAYDLNILNHHEIVNDRLSDQPIAAVW